jgi:hypothetical protein
MGGPLHSPLRGSRVAHDRGDRPRQREVIGWRKGRRPATNERKKHMETTTQTEPQNGNRPLEKIRFGRIQANIWENASDNGVYYTVTFERRYQDADGNWKSAQSFKLLAGEGGRQGARCSALRAA